MTYAEIYNYVVRKVWGASTPPTSISTLLQGVNGIIANKHQMIQDDYNYWFMKHEYSMQSAGIPIVYPYNYCVGDIKKVLQVICIQDLALDTERRKIVLEETMDKMSLKLSETSTSDVPSIFAWEKTQYPTGTEAAMFLFYPRTTDNAVLDYVISTFSRIARPNITDVSTISDYVTDYAGELIACLAAADVFGMIKEYDGKQDAIADVMNLLDKLKEQDRNIRQNNFSQMEYVEY